MGNLGCGDCGIPTFVGNLSESYSVLGFGNGWLSIRCTFCWYKLLIRNPLAPNVVPEQVSCELQRFQQSHLLVEVDLFHWEVTSFNLVGPNEHAISLPTLEIPLPLDTGHAYLSVNLELRKARHGTHDPLFFPIGSSYSTPTHTAGANLVAPTNLTVPRLWKPGSVDSIWHLEPTWMFASSSISCNP